MFTWRIWWDHQAKWRWSKYDQNDKTVDGNIEGTSNMKDCIAEAEAHGFPGLNDPSCRPS